MTPLKLQEPTFYNDLTVQPISQNHIIHACAI